MGPPSLRVCAARPLRTLAGLAQQRFFAARARPFQPSNDCADANCAPRCNQPDSAEDGVNLRHVDDNSLAGSWNDQDPGKMLTCA